MAILSDKDRGILQTKFVSELRDDVRIIFFTQHESGLTVPGLECPNCRDNHQLLEELVAISPRLHLEVKDFLAQEDDAKAMGVERIPATVLEGPGGALLRFFGVPSGYEFATLVEDIISLSKGDPALSPSILDRVRGVTKPTHIQVFVTPT